MNAQPALDKVTHGMYVIGVETQEGLGGCLVDAVMQLTVQPPRIAYCCMKRNYTDACIQKTRAFTVSVLEKDCDPFLIANFGFQSGKDVDKWALAPHDVLGGLPVVRGAVATLKVEVEEMRDLDTHTLYVGRVVEAEKHDGTPMTYAHYQTKVKAKTAAAFKEYKEGKRPIVADEAPAQTQVQPEAAAQYVCSVCGYVYDGEVSFEELPEDYTCPMCGVPKALFQRQ